MPRTHDKPDAEHDITIGTLDGQIMMSALLELTGKHTFDLRRPEIRVYTTDGGACLQIRDNAHELTFAHATITWEQLVTLRDALELVVTTHPGPALVTPPARPRARTHKVARKTSRR